MAMSHLQLRPILDEVFDSLNPAPRSRLVNATYPYMPPETSLRRGERKRNFEHSIPHAIASGKAEILRDTLYHLKKAGLIVEFIKDGERWYRRIARLTPPEKPPR
jgi:hypothetical protein